MTFVGLTTTTAVHSLFEDGMYEPAPEYKANFHLFAVMVASHNFFFMI